MAFREMLGDAVTRKTRYGLRSAKTKRRYANMFVKRPGEPMAL